MQKKLFYTQLEKLTNGHTEIICQRNTQKKSCDSQRASVRRHIEFIPAMEIHYCRRDTNKTYTDGKLNLQILYEKYVEQCVQQGD